MKEFVVGNPFTTETELSADDDFLILACDGVSFCTTTFFSIDFCLTKKKKISYGMFVMIKMR
jgi:serine/threonine protein phosphatase PrpC